MSNKYILKLSLILTLVLSLIGLFLTQEIIKAQGLLAELGSLPATQSCVTGIGQEQTIYLTVNTHDYQVDGIQLVFEVIGNISSLHVQAPHAALQLANATSVIDNQVQVILVPQQIAQPFSNSTAETVLEVSFVVEQPGLVELVFAQQQNLNLATLYQLNQDILTEPVSFSFNFATDCNASPTPTNLPSPTLTGEPSATPTATPTATNTPGPSPTPDPEPTATGTPEPSQTPVPTATHTPIPTATNTPVPTTTLTPTSEPSQTPVPTVTATHTPTPTFTPIPTATATASPTPTFTPIPAATATASPTPTATPHPEAGEPSPTATLTPTLTPINSQTPTPTKTATSTQHSDDTNTSTTTTAPLTAPQLSVLSTSSNSVTLTWTEVSPATHYALVFTRVSDGEQYGSADVGNTNTYTVTNLSGGELYEFTVFAVNETQAGPRSNQVRTGVVTGETVSSRPIGEDGQVLGVDTSDQEQEQTSDLEMTPSLQPSQQPQPPNDLALGQVAGEHTSSCDVLGKFLPWLILLAQLIGVLGVTLKFKKQSLTKLFLLIVITGLSIVSYYWLRNEACLAAGQWLSLLTQWYAVIAVGLSLLVSLMSYWFTD
ncbi:MAG: hypothetical protein GF390_01175 [Candidatus Pacebacteria bacterium]|nr:hypothetical protein [Candidatus Paceibacterota bacterium]